MLLSSRAGAIRILTRTIPARNSPWLVGANNESPCSTLHHTHFSNQLRDLREGNANALGIDQSPISKLITAFGFRQAYLDDLPQDPFSRKTLIAKQTNQGRKVYSVEKNEKDDQGDFGTPSQPIREAPDICYGPILIFSTRTDTE